MLQDRILSVDVGHVVISPRMDLTALVLDNATVAIQRLSWDRLGTVPAAREEFGDVSALEWRHDGSCVALGSKEGRVRIEPIGAVSATLSKRAGSASAVRESSRSNKAKASPILELRSAVTALAWGETTCRPSNRYEDRDASRLESDGVLAIGDADGCLRLVMFGLRFTIASVRVFEPDTRVSGVLLSDDGTTCTAVGVPADRSELELRRFSLEPLGHAGMEIHRAGVEAVVLETLAQELSNCGKTCAERWEKDAMASLDEGITKPLTKLVYSFAEDEELGPWGLLRNVFCGGAVNGALDQFLSRDLRKSGAKEILRLFTEASDEARDSVYAALSIAERVLFRTVEYRGLVRAEPAFGQIGIDMALVDAACSAAQACVTELGFLAIELGAEDARIRIFLKWLMNIAPQDGGADPRSQSVATSLSKHARDEIETFFSNALAHSHPISESTAQALAQCRERALPQLDAACANLIGRPEAVLSREIEDRMPPSCVIRVPGPVSAISPSFRVGPSDSPSHVEAVFVLDDARVGIARHSLRDDAPAKQGHGWTVAVIGTSPKAVKIVGSAYVSDGRLVSLGLRPLGSTDANGKVAVDLITGTIPADLAFGEPEAIIGTNAPPPTVEGRWAAEICTAQQDATCTLRIVPTDPLASVCVGARRVLLLDLAAAS